MPKAELESVLDDDLEIDDQSELELEDSDDENESESEGPKRQRLTLADENSYVFPVSNKDVEGTQKTAKHSLKNLKYTNGEVVTGFRVWDIIKDAEYDKDDNLSSGEVVACVLARSSDQASRIFLEDKNYDINLAFKLKRRGRGKTKIDDVYLMYGKMLQQQVFPNGDISKGFSPNADAVQCEAWTKFFGVGGTCHYYLNPDNTWKEATK